MRVPTYALLLCTEVPSTPHIHIFWEWTSPFFLVCPWHCAGEGKCRLCPRSKQAAAQATNRFLYRTSPSSPMASETCRSSGNDSRLSSFKVANGQRHSRMALEEESIWEKKAPLNRAFLQDYWGQIGIENRGSAFFTKK